MNDPEQPLAAGTDLLADTMGEDLFSVLFEFSSHGKALVSVEGLIDMANLSLCHLLGYAPEELHQLPLTKLGLEADCKSLEHTLSQLGLGLLESYQARKQLLHREGQLIPVQFHLLRLQDPAGGSLALLLEVQDLSHEQFEEEAWRLDRDRLILAERLAKVGYAMMDPVTNQGYWSPELFEIFGQNEAFAPSFETAVSLFEPGEAERVVANVNQTMLSYEPGELTVRLIRPNGELRILRLRHEMLRGRYEGRDCLLSYVMDITPYLNQELEKTNRKLAAQNLQLKQLVSLTDDQLTGPLAGLQALAQSENLIGLETETRKNLDMLDQLSQNLQEARKPSYESLPVSIEQAVQKTLQMLEAEIAECLIKLELDFSSWSFIEYVPYYFELLIYQLFHQTLRLAPLGKPLQIRLRNLFDEMARQMLFYEVEGLDLSAQLQEHDSPLSHLKTLLEAQNSQLSCQSVGTNSCICLIRF